MNLGGAFREAKTQKAKKRPKFGFSGGKRQWKKLLIKVINNYANFQFIHTVHSKSRNLEIPSLDL